MSSPKVGNKRTHDERSPTSSPTSNATQRRKIYSFVPKDFDELRQAIKEYRNMKPNEKENYWLHWNKGMFNDWDVSNVTKMENLFRFMGSFNHDISEWDVSNVKDFSGMFEGCKEFNKPLNWNFESGISFNGMFNGCEKFNQPVNHWRFTNPTYMSSMFSGCKSFNQSVSDWDLGREIEDLDFMFYGCKSFNQPIYWNLYSVKSMKGMFMGCTAYNKPFIDLTLNPNVEFENIFDNSGMSDENKRSFVRCVEVAKYGDYLDHEEIDVDVDDNDNDNDDDEERSEEQLEEQSDNDNDDSNKKECAICLNNIEKNKFKTRCNHYFHKECLKDWCKISSGPCKCPLCRAPINSQNGGRRKRKSMRSTHRRKTKRSLSRKNSIRKTKKTRKNRK